MRQDELVLDIVPRPDEIAPRCSKSAIPGLGLAAVVLSIYSARRRLQGKEVTVYIDNNSALEALINGDSSSIAAFRLIGTLRYLVARRDIAIWLDRAESTRNVSDLPTRNRSSPFMVLDTDPSQQLQESTPFYTEWIAQHAKSLSSMEVVGGRLPDIARIGSWRWTP